MQKSLLNSISLFRVVPRAEKLLNQSELKVNLPASVVQIAWLHICILYKATERQTTEPQKNILRFHEYLK